MSNLVNYGTYSPEAANKEREFIDKMTGKAGWYKLMDGRNQLRILPPENGKNTPFTIIFEHTYNTPDGFVKFACPKAHADDRCPACERHFELMKSVNPVDKQAAQEHRAKLRAYANVIDRNNPEKGVQIAGFPKTVYEVLNAFLTDKQFGFDFTNPDSGADVIIDRKSSPKIDYKTQIARTSTPLGNTSWITQQHDLEDKCLRIRTTDQIIAALNGESMTSNMLEA